jgi:hypothetical protein
MPCSENMKIDLAGKKFFEKFAAVENGLLIKLYTRAQRGYGNPCGIVKTVKVWERTVVPGV